LVVEAIVADYFIVMMTVIPKEMMSLIKGVLQRK
jgi:hypothetical protein